MNKFLPLFWMNWQIFTHNTDFSTAKPHAYLHFQNSPNRESRHSHMSLESVRQHLQDVAPDLQIIETENSSATVDLAAAAHNVEPGQIAKTLSLRVKDAVFLLVARGDARLDNKKA